MAPNDEESRKALATLIATATTLLEQLQSTLTTIQRNPLTPATPSSSSPETTSINALSLARDTSLLIRAHSTKISLLIINEPFTPSAISTVIRELIKGPIPGLATAAQACTPDLYTSVVRKELAYRCQKVLVELWGLLKRVPDDGKVIPALGRDGSKGSLVLTGKLWSACDEVVKLADLGVGGFYVRKAEEWRDTLKDVMEELKEWGEEEDDEDDVDGLADDMNNASLTEQEMVDDLMNSSSAIPKSDPDKIRPRLDSTLKRLRMIVLLYQAISKRRFKKLPKDTTTGDIPSKLDKAASVLETLPDKFGDLAGAFYELDAEEIDRLMEECFESAVGVSEVLKLGWEGESDEFSEWMEKFKAEVKKT
ncbi:hypothetical protein BFJ68_g3091 [Fusarium oxysporum]|uniref:Cyclin-D1-binding protein 1-like N-terminal domain-containing protein n=1 Tax=Fusarium oxysporum TaxID=5507 RepID=A0A420RTX2_FUSOX|nr:hypothetical protein BFJ68_g3091 [Fusarium oxysporum]